MSNVPYDFFDPQDLPSHEPGAIKDNTPLAGLVDDEQGDPEGAERRLKPTANEQFESWVLIDFEASERTYWGKKWPDGKVHLIPRKTTVQRVIDIHMSSWKYVSKSIDMAMAEKRDEYTKIRNHYLGIIAEADSRYHFQILKGVGQTAQTMLAERAYRKDLYLTALNRVKPEEDPNPEFLSTAAARMEQAAIDAGFWVSLHMELWREMEWDGTPTYYVENDIIFRLVQSAKYLDENYRITRASQPGHADLVDAAMQM